MAVLQDSDILDLVTTTQRDLGRMKFTQIATDLPNYEAFSRIMKRDRVGFGSGYGIQRNIMHKDSGAARNVGMFEVDNVNISDVMVTMDIPWRHTETHYAFDVRELLMNRSPARIVELLRVRRIDALISLAELCEGDFWTKPVDSTDTVKPFGLAYWITYSATEGHNGGNPSGFSSGAGNIDVGTYTSWKNYTAQYVNITKADLITKMRKAYRQINFKSPVSIPDYRDGRGDQYRIYTNDTGIVGMEDLGESQNENLGRDVASMDDTITFRRNPIVWISQLDSNTDQTDPFYMVNFADFYPVFLQGDYLREGPPRQAPNQHNARVVFIDTTWNIICKNRRTQALIAKS